MHNIRAVERPPIRYARSGDRWISAPDHPWGITRQQNRELLLDLERNWPSESYVRGGGAGMGADADPRDVAFVMRVCQAGASPAAAVALEKMNAEVDIRDLLPTISVPTLVVGGSNDPIAPAAGMRAMADAIPLARYVEFPSDTHFVGRNRRLHAGTEYRHYLGGHHG